MSPVLLIAFVFLDLVYVLELGHQQSLNCTYNTVEFPLSFAEWKLDRIEQEFASPSVINWKCIVMKDTK
jgi:hypothetical protein